MILFSDAVSVRDWKFESFREKIPLSEFIFVAAVLLYSYILRSLIFINPKGLIFGDPPHAFIGSTIPEGAELGGLRASLAFL